MHQQQEGREVPAPRQGSGSNQDPGAKPGRATFHFPLIKLLLPKHVWKLLKHENPKKGIKLETPKKGIKLKNPKKGIKLKNPKKGIKLENPKKGIKLENPKGLESLVSI